MFPPYFVFTNNNLCEEEHYVFLKSFTIKSIFWFSGYYMHIPFGTISWRTTSIDRWIFFSSGWFNVTEINPNIFFVGFCLNISYSFYANSTPMQGHVAELTRLKLQIQKHTPAHYYNHSIHHLKPSKHLNTLCLSEIYFLYVVFTS